MRPLLLLLPLLVLPNRDGYGAAGPEFEVATIKLNTSTPNVIHIPQSVGGRFHFPFNSLKMLIATAYKLKPFEILDGPSWLASNRYDVEAKSSDPNISEADFRLMMQNLLADRFKLKIHKETRELPMFSLVVAKGTSKLRLTPEGGCGAMPCGVLIPSMTRMHGGNISMHQLVDALSNLLAAPVVDNTGYTAPFDVQLEFTREGALVTDDSPPSIFTAIQEQLGLRLEAHKAPAEVLVIDHAEKPSEN
jgi:uncharacterized protein (TIGR03435 family)